MRKTKGKRPYFIEEFIAIMKTYTVEELVIMIVALLFFIALGVGAYLWTVKNLPDSPTEVTGQTALTEICDDLDIE